MNKIVIVLGTVVPSSRWKVWLYRRIGFQIARHTTIRRGSYIYARRVSLGQGVVIEPRTRIVCDELVMGDESKIDSEVIVYGAGRLEMGAGSYIGARAWINCEALVSLGMNTGVGPGSAIYTHGVWLPYVDGYPRKFEPVILEDGVWVPGNVTIQPGVRIGSNTMIGTGAVITKDVPSNSFVAGSPAIVVSSIDAVRKKLSLEESAGRAREAIDAFLDQLRKDGVHVTSSPNEVRYASGVKSGIANRSFDLVLLDRRLAARDAASLRPRSSGRELLLICTEGIDDEALSVFARDRRVTWFDFAGRRCRATWKGYGYKLRRYFGSHYGVRFRLV